MINLTNRKTYIIRSRFGDFKIRETERGLEITGKGMDFTAILQNDEARRQIRNFNTSRVILNNETKPKEQS